MVEFVHDEGYVNTLHLGVIDPGLVKAVCAEVASQVNFFAYSRDKFPGLSLFDGLLGIRIEKQIASWFFQDIRTTNQGSLRTVETVRNEEWAGRRRDPLTCR